MGEWARVLSPGGYLVMTFPDLSRVCLRYLRDRALDVVRDRHRATPADSGTICVSAACGAAP